jgi:hypothetical protein
MQQEFRNVSLHFGSGGEFGYKAKKVNNGN